MNLADLSQVKAAALLGIAPRTLRDWDDAPRNGNGRYTWPDLLAYRDARLFGSADTLDGDHERARKDRALADMTELKNAETRGDVARVSVMEREVGALFADLRQKALALPTTLAPVVVSLTVEQARDRIETAVYELLNDVADYRPGRR